MKRTLEEILGYEKAQILRQKLSEAHKGSKNFMYGRHHSPESRLKISTANKGKLLGRHLSEETKRKMLRWRLGPDNPMRGRALSELHKDRISKGLREHYRKCPRKCSEAQLAHLIKLNKTKNRRFGNDNASKRPEVRAKISAKLKGRKRPDLACGFGNLVEFRKKKFQGLFKRPTAPEKVVIDILAEILPNEYKYVGNGGFILHGLCPDFLNVNGQKKIIEVFGRVFHDERVSPWSLAYFQTEHGRKDIFKRYGFETLIIWDDELADRKAVTQKILTFNGSES